MNLTRLWLSPRIIIKLKVLSPIRNGSHWIAKPARQWIGLPFLATHIDKMEFLGRIPHSDNPDIGFVGRYDGQQGQLPPNSYGVHADPIANLLNELWGQRPGWKRFFLG